MEVTPLDLRGVRVLSGDGAKPHGRDTSPPKEEQSTSRPTTGEWPVNIAVEKVAATLRHAAPSLDPAVANRIARELLSGYSRWTGAAEGKTRDSGGASQVDTKA